MDGVEVGLGVIGMRDVGWESGGDGGRVGLGVISGGEGVLWVFLGDEVWGVGVRGEVEEIVGVVGVEKDGVVVVGVEGEVGVIVLVVEDIVEWMIVVLGGFWWGRVERGERGGW